MFLFFIFFPILLLSQDSFLLPDEATYLNNNINLHIKKAKREIYIFSSTINNPTVVSSLKKIAKKDIKITIITHGPVKEKNSASYLSIFQNISVFSLKPLENQESKDKGLKGSFICIDNKELFLLTEIFNIDKMKQNYSFALYRKQKCKSYFLTLIKRSKYY